LAENFQEAGWGNGKHRKLAKIPKNSTICLFQGRGGRATEKKGRKIAKKAEK